MDVTMTDASNEEIPQHEVSDDDGSVLPQQGLHVTGYDGSHQDCERSRPVWPGSKRRKS